jgi:hypothetical protein
MKNSTLNFNYMKARVENNPKDWVTYTLLVVFAAAIVCVAMFAHN